MQTHLHQAPPRRPRRRIHHGEDARADSVGVRRLVRQHRQERISGSGANHRVDQAGGIDGADYHRLRVDQDGAIHGDQRRYALEGDRGIGSTARIR